MKNSQTKLLKQAKRNTKKLIGCVLKILLKTLHFSVVNSSAILMRNVLKMPAIAARWLYLFCKIVYKPHKLWVFSALFGHTIEI